MPVPSLSPIVSLLEPPVDSGSLFDIMGNSGVEGYFGCAISYIELLSGALAGLEDYLGQEDDLDEIQKRLDSLHGKIGTCENVIAIQVLIPTFIVDTRAAHLDRSRVKAALQHLSFRIYYQQKALHLYRNQKGKGGLWGYFEKANA